MRYKPVIVITNQKKSLSQYLNETLHFRSLIWALAYRDIKSRYTQSLLGSVWLLVQPLIYLFIYALFFGYLVQFKTNNTPYILYVFCGIICWQLFTSIVNEVSNCLIKSGDLLHKIYFSKLVLPLSKVLLALTDFLPAFLLLLTLTVFLTFSLYLSIFLILPLIASILLLGLGIGLWVCALSIFYRDLLYIVPTFLNILIWLTPVFYPETILPQNFKWLLFLNPMAGILSGIRWALFSSTAPSVFYIFAVIIAPVLIFVSGLYFFIKVEGNAMDNL